METTYRKYEEIVDDIKRIDPRDIVGNYIDLTDKGSYSIGLCPFHEDNKPSFSVQRDGGCKCHACNWSGDSIKFVEEFNKVDFKGAITEIANNHGIQTNAYNYNTNSPPKLKQKTQESTAINILPISPEKGETIEAKQVFEAYPIATIDNASKEKIEVLEEHLNGRAKRKKTTYFYGSREKYKLESFDEEGNRIKFEWNGEVKEKHFWWDKKKGEILPYHFDEIELAEEKVLIRAEGEKDCDNLRRVGILAIHFNSTPKSKHIEELKDPRVKLLVSLTDNDEAGLKQTKKIGEICAKKGLSHVVVEIRELFEQIGQECPPKGDITDFLKALNSMGELNRESVLRQLNKAISRAVTKTQEVNGGDDYQQLPVNGWCQGAIADYIAEKYRDKLAWDSSIREWRRYAAQLNGIWDLEFEEYVHQIIRTETEDWAIFYATKSGKRDISYNFVNGISKLLRGNLGVRKWDEVEGLVPMKNGVLNPKTYEFKPHAPGNRLTWCLPYEYNPAATCEPILDWLLEMTQGDPNLVNLLRAILYGVVTGKAEWQKYLELIGPGGTGKSTYIRIAIALVGAINTHTTTLKKLENSSFETASVAGKRLVVITDSERYAGNVTTLKAITGQDLIPFEKKFKQSNGGFNYTGMVIVAANETIQSSDYTSGLERRRITVPLTNRIPSNRQRNLIEHINGKTRGEFANYLPGLLNWVLGIGEEEASSIVRNYQERVPSLSRMKTQTLVETNPIADWLDNAIVYRLGNKLQVGVAKRDKDPGSLTQYQNTSEWAYANYCEYCANTQSKPVGLRRFVNLLSDLCNNQLGLPVKKTRDRWGRYFVNLKIRELRDTDPPLITGGNGGGSPPTPPYLPPSPSNYKNTTENQLSINTQTEEMYQIDTNVTDDAGCVTDSVTDETFASAKCDGCAGLNEPSFIEKKNNSEQNNFAIEEVEAVLSNTSSTEGAETQAAVSVTDGLTIQHQSVIEPTQSVTEDVVHDNEITEKIEPSVQDLMPQINQEIERIGWETDQINYFLSGTLYQVSSLDELSYDQQKDFLKRAKEMPVIPEAGKVYRAEKLDLITNKTYPVTYRLSHVKGKSVWVHYPKSTEPWSFNENYQNIRELTKAEAIQIKWSVDA